MSRTTWFWLALALLCLLFAFGLGFHGLNLIGTAGDGMFEPPQVCNSECQDGWKRMGDEGVRWMTTAGIFFATGIVFGSLAWQARRNRAIKIEPISPHASDDPLR